MNEILNYVLNYGFSTVMCLLMWKYISTTSKSLENAINELTNEIKKGKQK